ncbi:MAG: radical SAM protein [Deltaproteobacteria bacterium]|nr:radical SAM protein [Deltaproteobacteria bacterium]
MSQPDGPTSPRALPVLSNRSPRESHDLSLAKRLRAFAEPAQLFSHDSEGTLRCTACAHRCVLQNNREGACGVRFSQDGVLYAPRNYVARQYVRSVEINTVFHVRPGARALTFGMFGCDLRCPYCHNWRVSQALREQDVDDESPLAMTAQALVQSAIDSQCTVICAAYNEPMIAAEWVREVFAEAKSKGLVTAVISDGHTTQEALAHIRPVTDVFRVDLKASEPEQYRALGGRLAPVLEGIALAHAMGFWVEVVTMVVPGFNNELHGLRTLASHIAAISQDIPWHLNAFVPRYKLGDRPRMEMHELASAVGMGYARGLKYVYASNAPGGLTELSHTRCPECATTLVTREDYRTTSNSLKNNGECSRCGYVLAGLFGDGGTVGEALGEGEAP